MKNLRKYKHIRRALLCQRLLSAAAVLQYYEAYFRIVDCATLAKTGGISYSNAEDFSYFIGNVFGCDVNPSDFVYSQDELSDLDSLSHILGHEFFKYGVQIVWHHGYVSIDLKNIIEYFDLNYKKIA